MSNFQYDDLSNVVIGAALEVHTELGPGLLESAYQAALAYELDQRGLLVREHVPVPLIYKGLKLNKCFEADIIVNDELIIELKATEDMKDIYYKQLLSYLRLTDIKVGLLINFNNERLKDGIKRIVNGYN